MRRGQQIVVKWADIQTEPAGDPEEADLYVWTTPGFWWGYSTVTKLGKRIRCAVITTAQGEDTEQNFQAGYLCIPANLILDVVEVVDED